MSTSLAALSRVSPCFEFLNKEKTEFFFPFGSLTTEKKLLKSKLCLDFISEIVDLDKTAAPKMTTSQTDDRNGHQKSSRGWPGFGTDYV